MKNNWSAGHSPIERDRLSKIVGESLEVIHPSFALEDPSMGTPSCINGVDLKALFEKNAQSFAFAASAFSESERKQVEHIYAFCRITDDLVDLCEDAPPTVLEARLKVWLELTQNAYNGRRSGIFWLDELMDQSAQNKVPFQLIHDLIEGIRSDINLKQIQTLNELDEYCYRVASVVGLWMCHMFGIHDTWRLERAAALGRAMQLTNILRDVGEDLSRGRVYLPASLLGTYGLARSDLERMQHGAPITDTYRDLIRTLIDRAEAEYEFAWEGIIVLPSGFARGVAVAANVYRGIHHVIAKNRYDNLSRRAYTSSLQKFVFGFRARYRLSKARRRLLENGFNYDQTSDEVWSKLASSRY